MEQKNLCEWRQFNGSLKIDTGTIPVSFKARIKSKAEIEFDFSDIQITNETKFIIDFLFNDLALSSVHDKKYN